MVEIKKDNLEKALANNENKKPEISKEMDKQGISKEIEIGFHQGSLNTLINERNELIKMIKQVENVMQAHMKRLEELGIKIKTSDKKE
jgi:argininosuccinate synthase